MVLAFANPSVLTFGVLAVRKTLRSLILESLDLSISISSIQFSALNKSTRPTYQVHSPNNFTNYMNSSQMQIMMMSLNRLHMATQDQSTYKYHYLIDSNPYIHAVR